MIPYDASVVPLDALAFSADCNPLIPEMVCAVPDVLPAWPDTANVAVPAVSNEAAEID